MEQRRCNLGAGEEYKSPLMQPGMGKRQAPVLQDQIIVKEQIKIDGPLCPAFVADASQIMLNRLQELQQGVRSKRRGNLKDRIQIKPLSVRTAAWLAFVQRRNGHTVNPRTGAETLLRRQQVGMAVAEIGTEGNKCTDRGARDGGHGGN